MVSWVDGCWSPQHPLDFCMVQESLKWILPMSCQDDDITSLVSIISSLLLIRLHMMAWKGRTDRPTWQPADCLCTTCPPHSQTLVVIRRFKHTFASLFSPKAWNSTLTTGDHLRGHTLNSHSVGRLFVFYAPVNEQFKNSNGNTQCLACSAQERLWTCLFLHFSFDNYGIWSNYRRMPLCDLMCSRASSGEWDIHQWFWKNSVRYGQYDTFLSTLSCIVCMNDAIW